MFTSALTLIPFITLSQPVSNRQRSTRNRIQTRSQQGMHLLGAAYSPPQLDPIPYSDQADNPPIQMDNATPKDHRTAGRAHAPLATVVKSTARIHRDEAEDGSIDDEKIHCVRDDLLSKAMGNETIWVL